jgi:tRNA pseudouridine38-40 synthase
MQSGSANGSHEFMPRYKLLIEYDGTAYHGWQKQPDCVTVEGKLEEALSQILGDDIDIIGQGRTDSGVHAEAQVAHFDSGQAIERDDLLYALLGVLPRDISVWDLQQVKDDFHARFDAQSRQYRYQIVTRSSPLAFRFTKLVRNELDWEVMQKCAAMVLGTHDFVNFSKTDDDRRSTVCAVEYSAFQKENHYITYHIRANRFVHHMVRRLVGSMLQVGKGKETITYFGELLHHPEHTGTKAHGITAKGLVLEGVQY